MLDIWFSFISPWNSKDRLKGLSLFKDNKKHELNQFMDKDKECADYVKFYKVVKEFIKLVLHTFTVLVFKKS